MKIIIVAFSKCISMNKCPGAYLIFFGKMGGGGGVWHTLEGRHLIEGHY